MRAMSISAGYRSLWNIGSAGNTTGTTVVNPTRALQAILTTFKRNNLDECFYYVHIL